MNWNEIAKWSVYGGELILAVGLGTLAGFAIKNRKPNEIAKKDPQQEAKEFRRLGTVVVIALLGTLCCCASWPGR